MSWLNLNQSFSSLKGQITNFATEVLSEIPGEDSADGALKPETTVPELQEKCQNQELEIAALKKLSDELQASLHSERLVRQNGVKEEESSWYWDPPAQTTQLKNEVETQYKVQIRALQDELSTLKERDTIDMRPDTEEEIHRLREENLNLTANLEDLDTQHQQAMDKLISLKKELQKNFEFLKHDHEVLKSSNDEYADENKMLLEKVGERDKEIESIKTAKADYETLHHKYQNLERIYALLRENAEKFQEENQDLHEEVFKLQEEVTKLEHDLETLTKDAEVSSTVPKEKYDEVLRELNDLKDRKNANQIHLDEINIDDNAKSVIENLKREINDLQHQLNQKEVDSQGDADHKLIKSEKIMQMYNKYVNFEIPLDFVGEIPSVGDNLVIYKLESVFKTVNSFKKDVDTLEHLISEKNHNINHLQTQIDDLTTENDFLTTDIQHFERELNEMKKNNDFLISEITSLKNTSKLEPIIETNHEDNLVKLETELADCNRVNKTFESEIKRIEQELADVSKEKVALQESLADLRTKYTTMLSEIDMCKNKTEAVEELEKTVNYQQSENLKIVTDEIDNLKKKLNTATSKNEQLSIDNHIIENDKVLLRKEIDDLKNTIEEKASAHKELETLKLALDHKLHDFESKLDEVILHKNEVESEKLKLEEQVALLETKLLTSDVNISVNKEEMDYALAEKKLLDENLKILQIEHSSLNKSHDDALRQVELLSREAEKRSTGDVQVSRDKQLRETEISRTNEEIQKFSKLIEEKDKLINSLNSTANENRDAIEHLNQTIADLEKTGKETSEAFMKVKSSNESLLIQLADLEEKYNLSLVKLEEINNIQDVARKTSEELNILKLEIAEKNTQISEQNSRLKEDVRVLNECKVLIENKDKEIRELNQSIAKLEKSPENSQPNDYETLVQEKHIIEKELLEIKNNVSLKETEIKELQSKLEVLEKQTLEYKTVIDNSNTEKTELINLVNLKHNESIQYHNEIQRLNKVLLEQNNEFKHVIEEKDRVIQSTSSNCPNCENLRITLKEKDEIIKALNQNAIEFETMKTQLSNASEVVRNLTEKCDNADKNLSVQLEVVKKLTAENAQLSEQEQNSARELERLRRHLVETEENYTQELMTSEQKLTECQTRLHTVEDRAKQTSTVYTSNSIRANQEVETLRTQIKLLEKQREEVQAKLSEADDARSRSEAALTNLQIVLEQFQLDKERDIHAATEKLRNKMDELKRQNHSLQDEISRLNNKLEESSAGLQAATRLGDQLETRTGQMNDLKEQVRTLQTSVAAAEERYHNAISNQQDKVDKNLVKNLIINYVMTHANSKTQVLRILSTVLDFNQRECEKLGLVKSAAPDSLAAEFVKFLQNESTPRPVAPPMVPMASRSTTPAVSRRSSTTGPNPTFNDAAHKRNPSTGSNNLLFTSLDNVDTASQLSRDSVELRQTLDTGINQTRNNEGAILKHVLRDME